MDSSQSQRSTPEIPAKKPPVIRGARACTVCRAAKMKCVGSEDGTKPCQRCKRANVECIFEKHRRGRKPGSKLSEASKMLRRLEKGLTSAKLKSQAVANSSDTTPSDQSYRGSNGHSTHFPGNELPPLNISAYQNRSYASPSVSADGDDDSDSQGRSPVELYPAKMIRKENFFKTILNNPEDAVPSLSSGAFRGSSRSPPVSSPYHKHAQSQSSSKPFSAPFGPDPITTGIMDENQATVLFDLVFLRLNPFINLFDPALHSVHYVRSRCPLLFTTLLMAGAKFFKPEMYRPCQKLANELAIRAFAEDWKSVEVVQAFACLVYWREPDDTRTWTYIGYACRMAVELGLNRYLATPPPNESEFHMRERRNRERTYLVLWVHDRSLSMQTGRQWMLPEDDLVKYSSTWHEAGGTPIRPEDVILAAFVQLRRIAAETMETTDVFCLHKSTSSSSLQSDVNYEVLLRNCNLKLTQWQEFWHQQMQRASGQSFHHAFLNFFRLYVRLFLNSLGVQPYLRKCSGLAPSPTALSACYTSALENLQIITNDFAAMSVLPYGQDSITIMSAYCAVFLLKLLRSGVDQIGLPPDAPQKIYTVISQAAGAYHDASLLSPASGSASYHSRFLRSLVARDRQQAPSRNAATTSGYPQGQPQPQLQQQQQPQPPHPSTIHLTEQPIVQHYPASPHMRSPPTPTSPPGYYLDSARDVMPGYHPAPQAMQQQQQQQQQPSDLDAHYWRNMFKALGYEQSMEVMHSSDGYIYPTIPEPNQYAPTIGSAFGR